MVDIKEFVTQASPGVISLISLMMLNIVQTIVLTLSRADTESVGRWMITFQQSNIYLLSLNTHVMLCVTMVTDSWHNFLCNLMLKIHTKKQIPLSTGGSSYFMTGFCVLIIGFPQERRKGFFLQIKRNSSMRVSRNLRLITPDCTTRTPVKYF